MAKRCARNKVRGPDGECYTRRQLKSLNRRGYFRKPARAAEASVKYGLAETESEPEGSSCAKIGGKQRVRVCVKRSGRPSRPITDADDVCRVLRDAENADRESFFVLYLDSQNRINGIEEAHKGTVAAVEVHPREVFKGALAANATAIIAAHNHPSGNSNESIDDINLTDRLVKVGRLLGIPVLDHIIVAEDGCTSIRESKPHLFREPKG